MTIFEFHDYRDYLHAHLKKQPRQGWGAMGRLAKQIQISPTQISQVLAGKKELTLEQAHRLGRVLELPASAHDYLLLLVERERAGTRDLQKYFDERLRGAREQALQIKTLLPPDHALDEGKKSIFYSDWRYSALRLFCSIGDGRTFAQILEAFDLDPARLENMLQFLVSCGLCRENKGLYQMGPQRTFIEKGSAAASQHQANWRLLALERAKRTTSTDEIFFTSPVSISKKDFQSFGRRLRDLIAEFSQTVRETEPDQVACLNLDYFQAKGPGDHR